MSTDHDQLAERLRTVERALVDGDPPESIASAADLTARVETLESDVEDLTERVLTLEAVVQALQGYAGHVQHVNQEIERQADTALAAVEELVGGSEGSIHPSPRPGKHTGRCRSESNAADTTTHTGTTDGTGERDQ